MASLDIKCVNISSNFLIQEVDCNLNDLQISLLNLSKKSRNDKSITVKSVKYNRIC